MQVGGVAGLPGRGGGQVREDAVEQHSGVGAAQRGVERVDDLRRSARDENVDGSGAIEVAVRGLKPRNGDGWLPEQQRAGEDVVEVGEAAGGVEAGDLLAAAPPRGLAL